MGVELCGFTGQSHSPPEALRHGRVVRYRATESLPKISHGFTRMDTDQNAKSKKSVFIRVHPWLFSAAESLLKGFRDSSLKPPASLEVSA
jgi:hypothetical protein